MTTEEIIAYWNNSSDEDYEVMYSLLEKGHYAWALFMGHLVLEKLLKAYYAKQVGIDIPFSHDLTKLAGLGNLSLSEEQKDFFDEVTTFNIKARYPDYKKRFTKNATKDFTEKYISGIKEIRLWLKKLLTCQ